MNVRSSIQTPAGKRRWALALALGVTLYITFADWILLPLHSAGHLQGLLGYLNGLSAMLQAPGIAVIVLIGWRHGHHTTTPLWFIMLPINFVLWTAGFRVALGMMFPSRKDPSEPPPELVETQPPPTSRRLSRRAVLAGTARVAAVGAASVAGYSFLFEPRRFVITRQTRAFRGLRPEIDGLRIVQLTDIHHGPNLSLDYVREVVAAANALRPDVTLLTGDYVYRSPRYIEPVMRELAELRANVGVLGVLGNHDWWEDVELTRQQFARVGIPLIDNRRVILTPDRQVTSAADQGLCIAGVGDYNEDTADFEAALGGVPGHMPRLLVSHQPDAAEDLDFIRGRYRVDLMVCGHTHGGQALLPGVGRPVIPSRYGQKYAYGSVRGPTCDVYVCSGIGVSPMSFSNEIHGRDAHATD